MNRNAENPYASHDNVALLLPWYVNKTLRGRDLSDVEQHLKICLLCNRDLLELQQLATMVKEPGSFDSSAQASFARFKNKLSAADKVSPVSESKQIPETNNYVKRRFPRPALALAATVLVTVFAARFIDVREMASNDYRTLSNAENLISNANEVKVIFKPEASIDAIKDILTAIDGHIVDGSNQQPLYIIGFNGSVQKSQVIDKISFLRKNEWVVFAEPAYAFFSGQQPEQAK